MTPPPFWNFSKNSSDLVAQRDPSLIKEYFQAPAQFWLITTSYLRWALIMTMWIVNDVEVFMESLH